MAEDAREGGKMKQCCAREELAEESRKTYLHVTFCYIQRSDAGVGETASESTAEHALCVVAGIVRDGAKIPGRVDW